MSRAYHTPLVADFAAALREHFASVTVNKPRADLYSCVTASRYPDEPEQIRELASVQWASTVRFRETVNAMYQDGVRLFVECGPRGNLTGFIEDSLRNLPHAAIPANVQHRPGLTQLHHLLGILIAHGVDLNLDYLYARRSPSLYPAETPPRKTHPIRIESGLQPLRLPAGFAVSKPVSSPVSAAPQSPPASGAVMEQYFANMRQFLANQQEVMQSYLSLRGTEPTPGVSAVQPARLPFVTEVVELAPGERAVVRHRFSLDRERLFQHHTLGKNVSEFDPSLNGLPVVPLTVTMEIMAEAAALLMPGKMLTGMREFRSSRWITLEHEPTIELEASRGSEAGAIRVVVRSAEAGIKGPIWAEGDMLFASGYASAPTSAAFALENEHPSSWSDDRLYVDGMFHGQSFMAVRHMRRSGKNGAMASLDVLARNELIASDRQPEFLTDPVILDAAGQVVAFWSQEELLPYCDIFPFHFAALHCYQPPQQPGTQLDCRVLVKRVTDREIESDIEIVDTGGNLHYRVEGWQDRRFLCPRTLWDLRISSGRSLVGKPWREPLSTYGGTAGLACSLVEDLPNDLLESSHGIWANVIAHIVLSRRERTEWDALRAAAVSKRALDWLRGRCAAKDAVRLLVKDRTGVELFAADVELLPDQWGRPSINGAWQDRLGVHPVVSLSHSGESAVALAAVNPSALVGVDLESIAQAADGFQDVAFQSSERDMVEAMSPSHRREWSLRLWCAKEAVAKALGRGMRAGFKALEVTRLEEESGTVYVELRDGLADEFPDLRGQPLMARTSTSKGFILSTVVSRAAPLE
jgi:phosphopantetheinyl transferase/malonyl CoA-acyl carrier protein transacylase